MRVHDTRAPVVLLVEDDPGDQELTRRALQEDMIQADLHIVSDGEEAMDYLLHRENYTATDDAPRPDLILLDLNMPKLDGKQVLKQIRAHETLRRIPVIVLTTSDHESDVAASYDLGCNSFITKPMDMGTFVKTIRGLGSYWFQLVTLPCEVPR